LTRILQRFVLLPVCVQKLDLALLFSVIIEGGPQKEFLAADAKLDLAMYLGIKMDRIEAAHDLETVQYGCQRRRLYGAASKRYGRQGLAAVQNADRGVRLAHLTQHDVDVSDRRRRMGQLLDSAGPIKRLPFDWVSHIFLQNAKLTV